MDVLVFDVQDKVKKAVFDPFCPFDQQQEGITKKGELEQKLHMLSIDTLVKTSKPDSLDERAERTTAAKGEGLKSK